MRIETLQIRNFRRLENVSIEIEPRETVFVGPNNSGKTSATAAFRCFLGGRDFKIHDFSVGRISEIDAFGEAGDAGKLPKIELDVWFSIDPATVEFGRAFTLLPKLSDEFKRLGVRLSFSIAEPENLLAAYRAAHPADKNGVRGRSLSQYLAVDDNLKRANAISYYSLEEAGTETKATPVDPKEGRSLLANLIRVDFVDAQRNIDDDDSSRSNRLSNAFASYYRKNLEQAEAAAEANAVIDQNNVQLTAHYEKQFSPLITLIKGLGVPSINDRDLKIISSLSPETALKGNTELLYVDAARKHELPELYNGLGFKNLIYMAIQARHFHSQWMRTPENRPLCQLIFIEEPEVHLHAQVQQTFIKNIWSVLDESAKDGGAKDLVPQLVVTTHSSHILDAVEFGKVRYFRRRPLEGETGAPGILNASEVRSLRSFKPAPEEDDGKIMSTEDALKFLQRYLRLTHCDLFFADGVILVEGAVEKLLLPSMIEKHSPELRTAYITILEVGGAYAHRFVELLAFLRTPYLVITDLDSVEPAGDHETCRADKAGALTSNASLKKLCGKSTVGELIALSGSDKQHAEHDRCVAFQVDISVTEGAVTKLLRPRTLEEALAYQNFALVRSKKMSLGVKLPDDLEDAYEKIYKRVHSSGFKKTDFAMNLLALDSNWQVPSYIADGLSWLEARLCPSSMKTDGGGA